MDFSRLVVFWSVAMALLDPDVSKEYFEAVQVAPFLVQQETRKIVFLRVERFQIDKAANRLALYWKYRKALFNDRWLLPMQQTGRGALSASEIDLIRCGYVCPISRPNQGPLLMIDSSRLTRTPGVDDAKVLYYMATVFCEDVFAQTDGLTVMYLVSGAKRLAPGLQREGWKVGSTALPVRVKSLFVVRNYEFGKEILLDQLAYQQCRVVQYRLGTSRPPECVEGNSVADLLSRLQLKGVDRRLMPIRFGGEYDYRTFDDWVRSRLSMEYATSSAFSTAIITNNAELLATTGSSEILVRAMSTNTNQAVIKRQANETEAEFKRRRNAFYVQRHYHKQLNQLKALEHQVQIIEQLNERLRADNRRLEELFGQAQSIANHQKDTGSRS